MFASLLLRGVMIIAPLLLPPSLTSSDPLDSRSRFSVVCTSNSSHFGLSYIFILHTLLT